MKLYNPLITILLALTILLLLTFASCVDSQKDKENYFYIYTMHDDFFRYNLFLVNCCLFGLFLNEFVS